MGFLCHERINVRSFSTTVCALRFDFNACFTLYSVPQLTLNFYFYCVIQKKKVCSHSVDTLYNYTFEANVWTLVVLWKRFCQTQSVFFVCLFLTQKPIDLKWNTNSTHTAVSYSADRRFSLHSIKLIKSAYRPMNDGEFWMQTYLNVRLTTNNKNNSLWLAW